MHAHEVCWREDGLVKFRGFKYEDQCLRFIERLLKKLNVTFIEYANNHKGTVECLRLEDGK